MKDARTVRPYQSSGECPHGNCFISEITLTEKKSTDYTGYTDFPRDPRDPWRKENAPQGICEITLIIKTPAYHEDLRVSFNKV